MKRIVGVLFLLCDMIIAPAHGQELLYRTGRWNADSLGNHRVVVEVKKNAAAVRCIIPWRRRDVNPQDKEVLIYSAADSSSPINNRILQKITRESGTIIFQPVTGAGTYYLYYLPYRTKGRNYPTVTYLKPVNRADAAWVRKTMLKRDRLPEARPVAMEAINSFNSFYPMEVIATQSEINRLLHPAGTGVLKPYYLFPEVRDFPVRMWDAIPYRWIKKGLTYHLSDTVQQNEYFAFQIAVYAHGQSISDLLITYHDLRTPDGHRIPAGKFTCFNKEGNNWDQTTMVKTIQIPKGKIQPLWFGVDVAENQSPGIYTGRVTIHPEGMEPQSVTLSLTVQPGILADRGDNEPWKHSRLRWLNSDIAVDDGIIPPYNPIEVEGSTLKILGREIRLGADGLPAQILSFFTQEMTRLDTHPRKLLVSPMDFMVKDENGLFSEKTSGVTFTKKSEGVVEWAAEFSMSDPVSRSSQLRFELTGHLEFDGFLTYQVKVTAPATTPVEDISFQIPICSDRVQYMLGLGRQGGVAPERFTYLWDPFYNCDGPWLGSVNAGLQATFRAENYERPLNTNFYHEKPLNMPPSWFNGGKGGIRLERKNPVYRVTAYSGKRTIAPGDTLHFDIHLLITPFRLINTQKQWHDRYYHSFKPLDTVAAVGANTINVHHATEINPNINYPFMKSGEMKAYIDAAHQRNYKVKIYYTVRELSNICPEIWALKSLGDEILSYGPGGGFSWLQEHLDGNYIPAWFVPKLKDAAIINSGASRWHNYYLEGLNWLVHHVGIDGLYIDDVAFDRSIMLRARKILERGNPAPRIDLHSASQFNPRDGFVNSANLYMEHFPFLDRLWFGEYFDYNAGPDYWLTEVSGIPFGLMGEMLQGGGNRWRGMLYGMTSRAPWSGDPTPLWRLWDQFGIQKSEMIGYWADDCPVKTGRPDVLATVYQKKDAALVAVASWARGPVRIALQIDWATLGLDSDRVRLILPEVKDFQKSGQIDPASSFTIPEGKGYLIWIQKK